VPPRRSLLLFTLFALVILSAPATLVASDTFRPVSPEELKMTSEPKAPGAPAIILYRQVDRDDSGESGYEINYIRIKILTEEGRKYADIELPFLKGRTNIRDLKARTIRPDGTITNFEGKPFEKQIVKAKGVKYMAKTFTMPDVQVGSIIEYTYKEELPSFQVFDSHWILSDELFTKKASFSLKPYSGLACRWSWHRLPEGSEKPNKDSKNVIRLEVNNVPAFPTEDYMPPVNELKSRVDFTYSYENPTLDAQKFWLEAGKKMNASLESFVNKRKAMEQAVATIVAPSDTPEQKLKKIYARVQQLRNTSFEIAKSDQEEKRDKQKQINNVEDVWKQGYGSGVELTWLFLGLARAAGLDASGVWVSDRRNYFFNYAYLDESKLNTNVVLVKLEGKEIYLDPGAAYTPYGMLPWQETGVQGLSLDKNGGTWVKTWLPQSSISRIEHHADLKLESTGELGGKVTFTFRGLEALRVRVDQQHADEAEHKKFLENLALEQIPVAAEVELTNKPDWTSSSPEFVAEYKIKIPGWMSSAGRRALLPIGIFAAAEKNVFDHTERTHPIYFEYPFEKQDDVSITLPLGWEVGSVPQEHMQGSATSPITYALKVSKDAGELKLSRKLTVDLMLVDTKYYGSLRNFFQQIRTSDEEQVMLQPIGVKTTSANK
jgi:hypothetical protein